MKSVAPAAPRSAVPSRREPKPRLPRFKGREAELLLEAVSRDNLFYHQAGGLVGRMTERACADLGRKHAIATSSGTAALHVAVGALEIPAGAEVITTPITDMGTLIAILYQNAIPVFADVDPHTYNLTADSIAAVMTERTKAVIVVHLAGSPCDMTPIMELCRSRGVKVIEDCAQAWGCRLNGQHVGGFGEIGCFSFNHIKHLSCGEGGLCVTDDAKLASRCRNFADKFYDRAAEGIRLQELAPNYRMTELQGAVALAQFDRLPMIASTRNALGERLNAKLVGIPGVSPHGVVEGGFSSYWFYMFRIDGSGGFKRDHVTAALDQVGAECRKGYLPRPIYREPVFANKRFFPGGVWPAEVVAGRTYDYTAVHCPTAEAVLDDAVIIALHEGLDVSDMDRFADSIRPLAR